VLFVLLCGISGIVKSAAPGHNERVARRECALDGGAKLRAGYDILPLHARRRWKLYRACNKPHARPAVRRGFRNGKAHLAAAAVGKEANGVYRLARGAGCDEYAPARKVLLFAKTACSAARNSSTGASLPLPVSPQASSPSAGSMNMQPRRAQKFDILLHGGWLYMFEFMGGYEHRGAGCEYGSCQMIVRNACGLAMKLAVAARTKNTSASLAARYAPHHTAFHGKLVRIYGRAVSVSNATRRDKIVRRPPYDDAHIE
jgi:hypothetical protein